MQIQFTYNGTPVGKGRPRAARDQAGNIRMYTPKTTHIFETEVANAYKAAYPNFIFEESDVLAADILIKIPLLKSFTKKQKQQALSGELLPAKKPDIDNILKSIFDSLNSVCYPDDNQITAVNARKIYSEEPGLDITITKIG